MTEVKVGRNMLSAELWSVESMEFVYIGVEFYQYNFIEGAYSTHDKLVEGREFVGRVLHSKYERRSAV